jgi:hypothetical protein
MITKTQRRRTEKMEASHRRVTQIEAFIDLNKMRVRHGQTPVNTTAIKILSCDGAEIEGKGIL